MDTRILCYRYANKLQTAASVVATTNGGGTSGYDSDCYYISADTTTNSSYASVRDGGPAAAFTTGIYNASSAAVMTSLIALGAQTASAVATNGFIGAIGAATAVASNVFSSTATNTIGWWIKKSTADVMNLYALTGNGATATETDTGIDLVASTNYFLTVVIDTDIRFYVNGVRKAIHTTNIPATDLTNPMFAVVDTGGATGDNGISKLYIVSHSFETYL